MATKEDLTAWVDVASSVNAWISGKNWTKASALYVTVQAIDSDLGNVLAEIIDPILFAELGARRDVRKIVRRGAKIQLSGEHVGSLVEGCSYVIYGGVAPVHVSQKCFKACIPRCSRKAGISRFLCSPRVVRSAKSKLRVSELFCGGVGGWTQAIGMTQRFLTVLAKDNDPVATTWFGRNNSAIPSDVSSLHPSHFNGDDVEALTCDIGDKTWLQALLFTECDVFTGSFPCTPWSTLGAQEGHEGEPGKALLSFLHVNRLTQPPTICMENVPDFRSSSNTMISRSSCAWRGMSFHVLWCITLGNFPLSARSVGWQLR